MQYFTKLFSRAPFNLLELHMEKVIACLVKLDDVLKIFEGTDLAKLESLSVGVSELEHEADLIKNDIRSTLPQSFLFSVDRSHFLEILSVQDDLADVAEEIANLLTVKELVIPFSIRADLHAYKNKNMEAVWDVKEIVFSFEELLEASFGGPIAEKIQDKIDQTAYKEHEADILKRKLLKSLFTISDSLSTPDFYLCMHLIEAIGKISLSAEKLAIRIGMLLDFK
ncbi:MAG: TIGR00153 family protein [Chlamydiae bacterium]|nr:TIGR00153 family protein [Chlamydiota bacterium]